MSVTRPCNQSHAAWPKSRRPKPQLTSAKTSPEQLLSGAAARLPASLHPCAERPGGGNERFPLHSARGRTPMRRKETIRARATKQLLRRATGPRRSFPGEAAVGANTGPPSHTFQFVFAALLLDNSGPMGSGGCHNEGGVSLGSARASAYVRAVRLHVPWGIAA